MTKTIPDLVPVCCAGMLLSAAGVVCGQPPAAQRQAPLMETRVLFEKARIPKIIAVDQDTILAFARGCSLCRRSTDGGKSWSRTEKLESRNGNVILDRQTGNLLIVCPGDGYLLRSADRGRSWKKQKIVVKPNAEGYGSPKKVPVSVACSESGITLRYGKHKGRLLMPGRLQPPLGTNAQEYWPYNYNAALYSDDGGKTWQTSDPVQSGTGEGTLVELTDGRIYYNSRCHMAVDHRRRIAWSHDGGHRWTDWEVSNELFEVGQPFYYKYGTKPSYGCNAGLVGMPIEATGGKQVLLFSTPDSPGGQRVRMTVWASYDGAASWPVKRLVYEGPSAYSSLAAAPNGTVFLLFENGNKGPYERITLARFNLAWLAEKTKP